MAQTTRQQTQQRQLERKTRFFPGDDNPRGQWPRPRYGSEWNAAAAAAPTRLLAFASSSSNTGSANWFERVLLETTFAETQLLGKDLLRQAEETRNGSSVVVAREETFVQAGVAARTWPYQWEFILADRQHWIWRSVRQDELVLWTRRPIRALQQAQDVRYATQFPWRNNDVLRLFDAGTLLWVANARIGRVGVRPQQGGGGVASTGYVTVTLERQNALEV